MKTMKINTAIRNICFSFSAIFLAVLLMSTKQNDSSIDYLKSWKAGQTVTLQAVSKFGENNCFKSEPISDDVFKRMKGKSYPQGCKVSHEDLRYIKVLHIDEKGNIKIGELVCNKAIANDILEIFHELYVKKYPIERMTLIDNYDADDEKSMKANNTSSFCYRVVAGSTKLSAHSQGLAIDINPLYNPYYKVNKNGTKTIRPSTARTYCDRSKQFSYKLEKGDLCHRLFTSHGFTWGGSWRSCKDFQHFERQIKK